ncbi:hypothetical protein MMC25_005876 [Agyrium rufum]|nr:hypothetical protein [Agyrium rufum]
MASTLHYLHDRLQAFSAVTYHLPQLAGPFTSNPATPTLPDEAFTPHGASSGTSSPSGDASPTRTKLHPGPLSIVVRQPLRTKTTYHLAQPPPLSKHKQRFKVRPKVLLQLQQSVENQRPRPTFDVLPSTVFLPKIGRKCHRILNGHTGLGLNDLVIARSQIYNIAEGGREVPDDSAEDDNETDNREIVAIVCQPSGKESKADGSTPYTEIIMSQGAPWLASVVNNRYEFVSMDENGHSVTARWVPSKPKVAGTVNVNGSSSGKNRSSSADSTKKPRYRFSILSRDSRRHPVIATMDPDTLSIFDSYTIPETPINTPVPDSPTLHTASPSTHRSSQASYFNGGGSLPDNSNAGSTIECDESLRVLIIATGVWVAFNEGWSSNFTYPGNHDAAASKTSQSTANSPSKGGSRTFSSRLEVGNTTGQNQASPNEAHRVPTPQSFASAKSHQAKLGILHRASQSTTTASGGSANGNGSVAGGVASAPTSPGFAPRRANSLGTVFMSGRAKSRLAKLEQEKQFQQDYTLSPVDSMEEIATASVDPVFAGIDGSAKENEKKEWRKSKSMSSAQRPLILRGQEVQKLQLSPQPVASFMSQETTLDGESDESPLDTPTPASPQPQVLPKQRGRGRDGNALTTRRQRSRKRESSMGKGGKPAKKRTGTMAKVRSLFSRDKGKVSSSTKKETEMGKA